jgi:hypothetical protein
LSHPDVVAAWDALTKPENLNDLEARIACYNNGAGMNSWAQKVTRTAIDVCRARAKES